ncbi:hypothetical protein lbkm_2602 [Lachnospiraceae bacterium KM106-2]|nr:hypothetical protein lbkm_2602 [Lachnospiraceae bacterium KM106-2]
MKNIGLYIGFAGVFMFFVIMSESIQGKLLGKKIDKVLEKQKIKTWMPIAMLLIVAGVILTLLLYH